MSIHPIELIEWAQGPWQALEYSPNSKVGHNMQCKGPDASQSFMIECNSLKAMMTQVLIELFLVWLFL